jgi:hypothetical protein
VTIVDEVERDEYSQRVLRLLLDEGYLTFGLFHRKTYLIDNGRVEAEWRNRRNRSLTCIGLIAVGVAFHNQYFREIMAPKAETLTRLDVWEELAATQLARHEGISQVVLRLGKYLEFMNRKSHGS